LASRGKHAQLDQMYVADFETCDTDELFKVDVKTGEEIYNQKVWLAGFKNLETMKSTYFYDLDSFMSAILSRGSNKNTEYAFHNIKFDGSYVIPYLLNNSYTLSFTQPQAGEFAVLVDDRNAWYSITIQVNSRRRVTLWDSAKLFPTALEYLHDIYATPTKKIHEDDEFYTRKRPEGYVPDEREMMYFENDLQVPAETINAHIGYYGLQFKKTQAGQAFYDFEQSFKAWKWRFPHLSIEEHEVIKPAYWGGIAHAVKKHAGDDKYNIGVDDINSSYPGQIAHQKLPYGKCLFEAGEGQHPDMSKFWVAEAIVKFTLKPDCLPCIPLKAISEGDLVEEREPDLDKWVEDSKGLCKMTFCSIDYVTIHESYDFTVVRWKWSMHWAQKIQKEMQAFVNKNNDEKVMYSKLVKTVKISDPKYAEYLTRRNRAKTTNNAFYGKFGEEIIKLGKSPYLAEDGGVYWKTDREDETKEGKRKFLPVAMAITAWGRRQLVIMANVLGEYLLYVDTDSVHYLKDGGEQKIEQAVKDGILVRDPEILGAWKHEGDFVRGRYLRAKCYMEEKHELNKETGEMEVHMEATVAGLPADKHSGMFSKKRSCLNWDNFHIGYTVPVEQANKLRTVPTKTGNKLLPTGFQIKKKESLFAV
jgi:hypothetical protein